MEFAQGTGSYPEEMCREISSTILAGMELVGIDPSVLRSWWIAGGLGVPGGSGTFFEIKRGDGVKTYRVPHFATAQTVADAIKA